MIGWMQGKLLAKHPPSLLLDVQGIGYEIEGPMTTFYKLPDIGESVTLFLHELIREDIHYLYGFTKEHERNIFRSLLKVNGVGARLGLTILSGMDSSDLTQCILTGDVNALTKLPGIGRKTAERLIIEMRDRLDKETRVGETDVSSGVGQFIAKGDPVREAVDALVALGFKPQEASQQIRSIDSTGLCCEDIVRLALKSLAK